MCPAHTQPTPRPRHSPRQWSETPRAVRGDRAFHPRTRPLEGLGIIGTRPKPTSQNRGERTACFVPLSSCRAAIERHPVESHSVPIKLYGLGILARLLYTASATDLISARGHGGQRKRLAMMTVQATSRTILLAAAMWCLPGNAGADDSNAAANAQ